MDIADFAFASNIRIAISSIENESNILPFTLVNFGDTFHLLRHVYDFSFLSRFFGSKTFISSFQPSWIADAMAVVDVFLRFVRAFVFVFDVVTYPIYSAVQGALEYHPNLKAGPVRGFFLVVEECT